jgi:hypothetical protein
MQMIKIQDIEEVVIKMFDDEAPPNLYFHNSSHVKNICNQAELLATAEKLSDKDFIYLKLAAMFLFTGFINDYDNPLESSLNNLEEVLPKYGFESETIKRVKNIIVNSYLEDLKTPLDSILHDAKYDYLGRVDFIKLTQRLFREETEYGKARSLTDWSAAQRKLLQEHDFLTDTGKLLRSVKVDNQIAALKELPKLY